MVQPAERANGHQSSKRLTAVRPIDHEMPPDEFFGDAPSMEHRAPSLPVWSPASIVERWQSEGPLVHEATGIASLDRVTGGGPVYGTRWVLNGAPDAGKTALQHEIGDTYARRGIDVGYYSLDEDTDDLATRIAQRHGFTREACELRDARVLRELQELLAELPIRIYGVEHTIESAAADLVANGKTRGARCALFVDSVQTASCSAVATLLATGRDVGERAIVTANMRALHWVAAHHRLIAFTTSEMSRAGYRGGKGAPEVNDMALARESSAIEYRARVMLSLRSVEDEPDLIELRATKNKHGRRWRSEDDSIFLCIDRHRMRLEESRAPEKRDAAEARGSAAREQVLADAAAVLEEVARDPGIVVRGLHAALRAAHGSFSKERATTAVAKLGSGIHRSKGARGAEHLFVAGDRIPADVLAKLPPERQATLSRLRVEEVAC